jgi:hypothetical protein
MSAWKVGKRVKPEDDALPSPSGEIRIGENGALSRSEREAKAGQCECSKNRGWIVIEAARLKNYWFPRADQGKAGGVDATLGASPLLVYHVTVRPRAARNEEGGLDQRKELG